MVRRTSRRTGRLEMSWLGCGASGLWVDQEKDGKGVSGDDMRAGFWDEWYWAWER
jgi:hypothetical protein